MQRRMFLKNCTTLVGALPFAQLMQAQPFQTVFPIGPEIRTFRLWEIACTVFQDFQLTYSAGDFFSNAAGDELDPALDRYGIPGGKIPSPFIAMLLRRGNQNILIDTGAGFSEKPVVVRGKEVRFRGRLLQLLQQEGIARADVTDIIITHFHPDHIGGLTTESRALNFPNAWVHLPEAEWNYWHSAGADNEPEQFKYFVDKNIRPLKGGNLRLVKGDFTEIVPGVLAVDASGHTPGQLALIVESAAESLLYASDSFLHPLHIERLDWQTNYDRDHDRAKISRVRLLEIAREKNMLVSAFHFNFPGLGYVDKVKQGWVWRDWIG